MRFELRHPAKKLAAAATLLVLSTAYLALITTRYFAARLSDVPAESRLKRAARLDPGNANYPNLIGRYTLLVQQSPQAALPWLESATQLNPSRASYWLDLAVAHQFVGDTDSESQALRHALNADPRTPEIAWQAANLFLARGSTEDAMRGFRLVMENDPPLTWPALQICWKVRPDIDFLLNNVVPPNVDDPFLEFLVARHESAAAAKVWERMYSLQQPIARSQVFEYIRHLVAQREASQAALVWRQAASLSGLAAYQPSPENLLVNGDFSLEILNGGFDWLYQKGRAVSLALDPTENHSSSRSLRIIFDGPGIEDAGIRQLVAVEPNTVYEFSAFYKAQEMDGAGGVKFAIQDLYRETPFFLSEDLRDADFWKKVSGTFTTGPDTQLLVVRIARAPAGSPIRGKLWIDGLQLVAGDRSIASTQDGSIASAEKETK